MNIYQDRTETFIPGETPTLNVQYDYKPSADTLKGNDALLNNSAYRPNASAEAYLQAKHRPDDVRGGAIYNMANKIGDYARSDSRNFLGTIMDTGPIGGGVVGGSIGLLGGLAAGYIKKLLTGTGNPWAYGLGGGALGAGLGGLGGYLRNSPDYRAYTDVNFNKQAAMFSDPRNYILEKLQAATDVGIMEKAQLAASVRNMDYNTASRLCDLCRAALGVGIGALVSKFIFGAGKTGMMLGGMAGLVGMALFGHKSVQPGTGKLLLGSKPNTYF